MKSFICLIVSAIALAVVVTFAATKPDQSGPVSQQRPVYVPAGTVKASYRPSSLPTVTVYDPRPVATFGWYNNGTPSAPGYLPTLTVLGLPLTGERPADPTSVGIMLQTADGRSWRADWKEER